MYLASLEHLEICGHLGYLGCAGCLFMLAYKFSTYLDTLHGKEQTQLLEPSILSQRKDL